MDATSYDFGSPGAARIGAYFDRIGATMRDKRTRASFAQYTLGLLTEGERKSVEPMAARCSGGDPVAAQRTHDNLLHFVASDAWEDMPIRRIAAAEFRDAIAQIRSLGKSRDLDVREARFSDIAPRRRAFPQPSLP
jgi:SRSO17 transposase